MSETASDDSRQGSGNPEGRVGGCGYSLFWSPDGSRFVTTGAYAILETKTTNTGGEYVVTGYPVRLWDAATMNLIQELKVQANSGVGVSWSSDGKLIHISPSGNNFAGQILDATTLQPEKTLNAPGTNFSPHSVLWSPDRQWLVMQLNNQTFLLNITTGVWKKDEAPLSSPGANLQSWLPNSLGLLLRSEGFTGISFWVYDIQNDQAVPLVDYLK